MVELLSFGGNKQINFSNSNNESSFNNVELEIQYLQLIISHQDETIEALKRNAILKNKTND